MVEKLPPALIVAGPTCSGKSAFALMVAERCNGVVINADSMQVYRELRVLTARPTPDDEARAPHVLYGVRAAADLGHVGWWREAALAEMDAARAQGKLPILCGGTGMYLAALTDGLVQVPEVAEEARTEARALLAQLRPEGLHARLLAADPETAAGLRPSDSQRLSRAWEVWRSSGRGLAAWRAEGGTGPAPYNFHAVRIDPPREALRAAIATRFEAMLAQGALDEVRALLALNLDPALPVMRAHGVPELSAYLRGEILLEEAALRTRQVTGQYTKRQATWARHHNLAPEAQIYTICARFSDIAQFSCGIQQEILSFIDLVA